MIDLLSTRTDDPQTARCAHLLCAVITQAVEDACTPPTREEQRREANIEPIPLHALEFLFGDDSAMPGYARLIGVEPAALRGALLSQVPLMHATQPRGAFVLHEQARRVLQLRHRWRSHAAR